MWLKLATESRVMLLLLRVLQNTKRFNLACCSYQDSRYCPKIYEENRMVLLEIQICYDFAENTASAQCRGLLFKIGISGKECLHLCVYTM